MNSINRLNFIWAKVSVYDAGSRKERMLQLLIVEGHDKGKYRYLHSLKIIIKK